MMTIDQFAGISLISLTAFLASIASAQTPRVVQSAGNPIIADGSYYSADPAPIVVGNTLYIIVGRDEAPAAVNGFNMNEWQLLATKNVAKGRWLHYQGILRPRL
jgi:hypothetical protein